MRMCGAWLVSFLYMTVCFPVFIRSTNKKRARKLHRVFLREECHGKVKDEDEPVLFCLLPETPLSFTLLSFFYSNAKLASKLVACQSSQFTRHLNALAIEETALLFELLSPVLGDIDHEAPFCFPRISQPSFAPWLLRRAVSSARSASDMTRSTL